MDFFLDTVLLIDDSEIDNIINRKFLEQDKFAKNIISMQSSEKALEYLSDEFKFYKKVPDIIFLDLWMPLMNGFTFLKSFETFPEPLKCKTKIVMLTSSLYEEDLNQAKENKLIWILISKPLSFEALADLKKKYLMS
jgi:CheY-like chemotaxis protein